MPLRAFHEDREILAPLLPDAEWDRLRAADALAMACCRAPGYARTSPLGTRHFVHLRRETCGWAPESELHLAAKTAIATACAGAGLPVRTEAAGRDWRADVLVERPGAPVAFEVQVTPIPREELEARQQRYRRDGVACWWLLAGWAPSGTAAADLPAFALDEALHVAGLPHPDRIATPRATLGAFALDAVAGRIAFAGRAVPALVQDLRAALVPARCSACRAKNHLFVPLDPYVTACGLAVWPGTTSADPARRAAQMCARPELAAAVAPLARARGLPIAWPGCVMCARPFAHEMLKAVADEVLSGARAPAAVVTARVEARGAPASLRPHWCHPAPSSRCRS